MSPSSDTDLCFLTGIKTVASLRSGAVRAIDVAEATLARVREIDPLLTSYTQVLEEQAVWAAHDTDLRWRGNGFHLDGITISVKDLIAVAGVRLTRGSRLFRDFIPTADAPVVERVKAAGGSIVGKTTTSELGWKCVTDSPLFGATKNPWDVTRTAGGSSGGAAAAVAAGLCTIGIGTDAGGSIRIPASFCGVVGLKPTFGAIPIHPAPAPANIVHIGIATRCVDDAALALGALSGPDPRDRFSLAQTAQIHPSALPTSSALATVRDLRVCWTTDFGFMPVEEDVEQAIARVAAILAERGVRVEPLHGPMPTTDTAFRTYFYAALGAQLSAFDTAALDMVDPGLRDVFEQSCALTAHDVINADLKRAELWDYLRRTFDQADVIVSPVVGSTAFELGSDTPPGLNFEPDTPTAWMGFTSPFNLVGLPALSVPCGRSSQGLPIGVQLVARHWDETTLFAVAKLLEEEIETVGRPPIGTRSRVHGRKGQ